MFTRCACNSEDGVNPGRPDPGENNLPMGSTDLRVLYPALSNPGEFLREKPGAPNMEWDSKMQDPPEDLVEGYGDLDMNMYTLDHEPSEELVDAVSR